MGLPYAEPYPAGLLLEGASRDTLFDAAPVDMAFREYQEIQSRIARLQEVQAAYNLRVEVEVLGERMTLQRVLHLVAAANRVKTLWAKAATPENENMYHYGALRARDKDNEYAQRVISLEAAQELAASGIEAEVIDLRSLRPLDMETILQSVARTRRAVIVDESWRSGSLASEIAARIGEQCFYELDAPVQRVCSVEVPMPYPRHLEQAALPQAAAIVTAVRSQLGNA